jgi:hypothetical protein
VLCFGRDEEDGFGSSEICCVGVGPQDVDVDEAWLAVTPLAYKGYSAFSPRGVTDGIDSMEAAASDADAKMQSSKGMPVGGGTEADTARFGGDGSSGEAVGFPSFARRVESDDVGGGSTAEGRRGALASGCFCAGVVDHVSGLRRYLSGYRMFCLM